MTHLEVIQLQRRLLSDPDEVCLSDLYGVNIWSITEHTWRDNPVRHVAKPSIILSLHVEDEHENILLMLRVLSERGPAEHAWVSYTRFNALLDRLAQAIPKHRKWQGQRGLGKAISFEEIVSQYIKK